MGIIRRIRLKMSLFEADRSTCPHHLVTLCGQSHGLATLILWANAAVIGSLALYSPAFAVGYLALFALTLVWLNRAYLFPPKAARRGALG